MEHLLRVRGLPQWIDAARLLGPGFTPDADGFVATHPTREAADVEARLRGLGFGGHALQLDITPDLPRAAVRGARLEDARRRRDTTPGFLRKGVAVDDQGRWSLTPEALALAIGQQAAGKRVIDACAGCCGNAIGFARAGCQVTAIEVDPGRLGFAKRNAARYEVDVKFLEGKAEDLLPELEADLVFIDPPWGADAPAADVGPLTWARSVSRLDELPALPPILAAARRFPAVWVKVPPSFDPADLPGFTPDAWFGEAAGDRQRVKFLLLRR